MLLVFLLQRYYAPLAEAGKVSAWKVYFQDESRFGLMTVLRRAKHLQVPQNIRLVYLPCFNPELNPIERFWRDMKDKVAFHNFQDEQELEA